MKKMLLLSIICIKAFTTIAQDNVAVKHNFTLEDCLRYALGNSYNMQSLKLSEDAQQTIYEQSKMERLPSVSASANENITSSKANSSAFNGTYSVSANMTLYQGGSISNTIEQNKLRREQASYQTEQYQNDLTIQILQSFLNVLGNEEMLKYQEVIIKASEEQLNQGREQFRVGGILESDYLLLEAQYANDQNNYTDTEIARDNSILTLKKLLSMRPAEELQIIYPDTSTITKMSAIPPMVDVIELAGNTLPSLKVNQYDVNIANMSVKLARSGYMPSLNLFGSVGTGHANDFSDFGTQLSDGLKEQVGLSLSVPIYSNNRNKSKVAQSRIAVQQAELSQKQAELDVQQTVATQYQDVVSAYNKYKITNIRQSAYQKTFDAYRVQFNAGAITAVDLLQQQNNYISALNDFIQSKYGFMLKRKILDVYMAVPIAL